MRRVVFGNRLVTHETSAFVPFSRCISLSIYLSIYPLNLSCKLSRDAQSNRWMSGSVGYWVSLVTQAASSNLYGLACPFYCTQPSCGSVIAAFLLGISLGTISTLYAAWILTRHFGLSWSPLPGSDLGPQTGQPVDLRWQTLSRYLHVQQPRRRAH